MIDKLDPDGLIAVRLYRENCTSLQGMLVKDLSTLKRSLSDLIIIDVGGIWPMET